MSVTPGLDPKITQEIERLMADGRDRSKLLVSPLDLEMELEETQIWMAGDAPFENLNCPRFGVLSLLLQTTPIRIYDHPGIKKRFSDKGFVDGSHIWLCGEYVDQLLAETNATQGAEYGLEPFLLLMLTHLLVQHTSRMKKFARPIRHRAADLSSVTRLRSAFPDITWVKCLRERLAGFEAGDMEKYPSMAEETIARELTIEQFNQKNKKGGGQGGPGGQQHGGQEEDPYENENYLFDLEDLIREFRDLGLEDVLSAMDLPLDEDDLDAIEDANEQAQIRVHDAVQQASSKMRDQGGKYPGAHLVDAASEVIRGLTRGKMAYKMAMREAVYGDGFKHRINEDLPGDLFFSEDVTEAVGTPLWLGQEEAFKSKEVVLVILDTSGSVSEEDCRAYLSEAFELKAANNGSGEGAAEVIIICGDTVMRGDPTEITEDNIDELLRNGVKIFGRGGTDVETTVTQALEWVKDKKIRSIVVMTDLYTDTPDPVRMKVPEGSAFYYVTAPSTHSSKQAEFAAAVSKYARVVEIREGQEVDLSEDFTPLADDLKANEKKPRRKPAGL